MAGRRPVIEGAVKAFESSRRRPELTMVLSGARGTGKTTLLSLISQEAEKRGWVAVGATAVPGMLEDKRGHCADIGRGHWGRSIVS